MTDLNHFCLGVHICGPVLIFREFLCLKIYQSLDSGRYGIGNNVMNPTRDLMRPTLLRTIRIVLEELSFEGRDHIRYLGSSLDNTNRKRPVDPF